MTDRDLPTPMRAFIVHLASDNEGATSLSPAVVEGVVDVAELVLVEFAEYMAENGWIFASVAQPLVDGQHRLSGLKDSPE